MSPYCHQMGHNEPSGSTSGIAGLETADPDTGTPTPSPTLSVTPSPPPHAEEPAEAAVSADDDQLLMVMNPLPVVQDGAPDCLPVDHNLPNLLRQVSGNADLLSVRDIKLRVISREMSLHRLALFVPNLRELNLDGSCLGSLRDLGCGFACLNVLRVSRCGLESLDGTFGLTSLRELHASHNMVRDAGPCSSLSHIRIIDLAKNAVEDLSFLEFLDICSHLEDLTLAECPVSCKTGYRAGVRSLLPNLITLDGIPIAQDGEEQRVENIDDDDDDDDDIDKDGGANYPDQDFFRPRSRYSFRHQPQTPPYDDTRSDYANTSGEKVSEHPALNKDDHGKGLGATAFDNSNTSNEEDYPDCSSSSYQTYSNLYSTQNSSFNNRLIQNRQKSPRTATIKKRPTTAVDVAGASEKPYGQLRKPRPSSAATTTGSDEGDLRGACVADPSSDSLSVLTSGLAICGNLTAALRSRRKRHDAWTQEDFLSALEPSREAPKTEVNQPAEEMAAAANEPSEGGEIWGEDPGILEESKTRHELYAASRSENRLGSKKEQTDSAESAVEKSNRDQTNMEEIREEDKKAADVMNRFQSKASLTCCTNLFTSQRPMESSSYQADISSKPKLSPQGATVKKRCIQLVQKE